MAKGKWARRFGRALRRTFRALDRTADKLANRPQKQVRHGKAEWGTGADGKPVHSGKVVYPTKAVSHQPVKWTAAHTHEDKERWRVTFAADRYSPGVIIDFVTYPLPRVQLEALAHERRTAMYGVYSDDWELVDLTLLGTLGGDEAVTAAATNEGE